MEKFEGVDLSALDPQLLEVEVQQVGSFWRATVIIGRVRYAGSGDDKFEAVGNLLRFKALRSKLAEGLVKES